MTEETQTQDVQQQEPVILNLTLTLDQVNFVLGALGKLPTETGAWIVRQVIGQQAQSQVEALQTEQPETTEETPTVQ